MLRLQRSKIKSINFSEEQEITQEIHKRKKEEKAIIAVYIFIVTVASLSISKILIGSHTILLKAKNRL